MIGACASKQITVMAPSSKSLAKLPLHGQAALVTGAGVRVGRAIALGLAEQGATVAVHYHSSSAPARQVVNTIIRRGGRGEAYCADLRDGTARVELFERVAHDLGEVRVLVNNAATFGASGFAETTLPEWDAEFETNLKAPFHLAQLFAAQRHGEIKGNIINISDWRGIRPGTDHFAYTITKAALIKMTEALALALAPRIRVNALALGSILLPPNATPQTAERLKRQAPLQRMGSPRDVVAGLMYLLGPGSYVTGETIAIDGGRHLVRG